MTDLPLNIQPLQSKHLSHLYRAATFDSRHVSAAGVHSNLPADPSFNLFFHTRSVPRGQAVLPCWVPTHDSLKHRALFPWGAAVLPLSPLTSATTRPQCVDASISPSFAFTMRDCGKSINGKANDKGVHHMQSFFKLFAGHKSLTDTSEQQTWLNICEIGELHESPQFLQVTVALLLQCILQT